MEGDNACVPTLRSLRIVATATYPDNLNASPLLCPGICARRGPAEPASQEGVKQPPGCVSPRILERPAFATRTVYGFTPIGVKWVNLQYSKGL